MSSYSYTVPKKKFNNISMFVVLIIFLVMEIRLSNIATSFYNSKSLVCYYDNDSE